MYCVRLESLNITAESPCFPAVNRDNTSKKVGTETKANFGVPSLFNVKIPFKNLVASPWQAKNGLAQITVHFSHGRESFFRGTVNLILLYKHLFFCYNEGQENDSLEGLFSLLKHQKIPAYYAPRITPQIIDRFVTGRN